MTELPCSGATRSAGTKVQIDGVTTTETQTECSNSDSDDSLLDILNSLDTEEYWDAPMMGNEEGRVQNSRDSGVGDTITNHNEGDESEGVTDSESEDRSFANCFDAVENIGDVMGNVVESVREEAMERDSDLSKRDNNVEVMRGVVRNQSINSDGSDNIITQFLDKSVEHVGCCAS